VLHGSINHVAFNAGTHAQVDEMHELVERLGGEILFEFVHMPILERRFRELGGGV
jgi:hypothetical protein